LDLSSNQITHIPNQINKVTQLQHIYHSIDWHNFLLISHHFFIWVNCVLTITNWISFHHNFFQILLVCIFDRNSITSISSTTLSSLTQLENLDLFENQITILPTQIGLLTSLQKLILYHNQLSFIPSDLVSEKHEFWTFPGILLILCLFRVCSQIWKSWVLVKTICHFFQSLPFIIFKDSFSMIIHSNFHQLISPTLLKSMMIFTISNDKNQRTVTWSSFLQIRHRSVKDNAKKFLFCYFLLSIQIKSNKFIFLESVISLVFIFVIKNLSLFVVLRNSKNFPNGCTLNFLQKIWFEISKVWLKSYLRELIR
jgi:Leucine-rich repeat (LRR) protein